MPYYIFSSLFVLIAALVSWLAGAALHLSGLSLAIFRVCILLLGIAAAFAVYFFFLRPQRPRPTAATPRSSLELAALLRSARQRLGAAQLGSARSFHAAPVLYVLGASNSAKTTLILKSGLDPELLAGQAYQDGAVIATEFANIWYAHEALLVDAGEAIWQDPSLWKMLVRRTGPRLFRSIFGSGAPLRAAVVSVSCESFFGPNAAEAVSALARNTNGALRVIAQALGHNLPVHVVLTKLDRVPGFAEYVGNLNGDEAGELLGVSLPREGFGPGVYAERAFASISAALDRLVFSLGEFRLETLGRETEPAKTPLIYQFPRELHKLRNHLTSYLVELARPSHLHANPSLRGFYITGVRAHSQEQNVSAAAQAPRRALAESDATRIFSLREMEEPAVAVAPEIVTRKVAQWCFLPRLFPEILLSGNGNREANSPRSRNAFLRRAALAAASSVLAILLVCVSISYRNNARLEHAVRDAALALPVGAPLTSLASVPQLATLDRLRLTLLQLEDYDRNGAPWMFRWGLYRGSSLLPSTRRLYFERFRPLLLTTTQAHIVAALQALPPSAPSGADYLLTYNPLRAYLITTSHPEHSTADFVAPVLLPFWLNGQHSQSDQQTQLALQQFRFYADELRRDRLYNIAPEMPAVAHARGYLNSFGGFDRIYQTMLAAASRTSPAIDFNRLFPGSAATVVETHVVPGAFSQAGFAFMQNAIAHPERYFTGESWVLGEQASLALQSDTLSQKLDERYSFDFSSQWQLFLRSASVVRYRSLGEAREKLGSLSSPSSALLALAATASRNTAVASPAIAHRFQPVQALVPANLSDRLIAPGNTAYINGLTALQSSVSQYTQDPSAANNPAAAQPVIAAAVNAHAAVSQTAQSFNIDPATHVEQIVTRLLQEPITSVEDSVRGAAPAQINLAGRAFCAGFAPLLTKFPFDRKATVEATPSEVAAAIKPGTGLFWQFYESNLKPLLVQGSREWTASPTAPIKPTPAFLQFFNRVAGLSNAWFSNGANTPTLNFTARVPRSPGIGAVTLALDAQRLSGADVSRQFTWSAQSAGSALLAASYGNNELPLQFSGPWALFHLIDRGRVEGEGNPLRLAYPLEISGTPIVVNGAPLTERIELSGPAAAVFAPGSLAGLHCVAQVAH